MKIRMEIFYKPKNGTNQYELSTDFMPVQEALFLSEDLEKTGRIAKLNFLDETDASWLKKHLKKYLESLKEEPHNVLIYFDGGYNEEQRLSGVGVSIYYEQNDKYFRLRKNDRLEQLNSNNEAEFAALFAAINELENLGVHHLPITVKGDSLVVINQAKGEWPCYEEEHIRWLDRIEAKIKELGLTVTFEAISRSENKEADHLATQALAETFIDATSEVKGY
ncbi:reverse transcriptase-like protein [Anaerobacillus isosaccharinicus]|uniref:Reverse transcriptase-like protein n=1 Tax=Anaerobacillus isosaccharinicus TaxID=1532552 RepID=A0A7S7L5L4_9BACI|nr:reverse transcriptase-like protein [Anaerobacillus isosaccharinicus]MBA5586986.1 reverse transcriptase-like protein [Anaerobacillus isosaccharinicus]QOY34810.1 reverse transcriptase-like protein [Anaerobacillus isosaccharinicus]